MATRRMRDIGTLGGPDTWANGINNRGQITGYSFKNSTANAVTGVPTADPFLWQKGHMRDLGTLGGTNGSAVQANNKGQVIGVSNLVGDAKSHPFFWSGHHLIDLVTMAP